MMPTWRSVKNLLIVTGIVLIWAAVLAIAGLQAAPQVAPADCPGHTYTTCSPVSLGSQIKWQGASWNVLGITITNGETRLLLTGVEGVESVAFSALSE